MPRFDSVLAFVEDNVIAKHSKVYFYFYGFLCNDLRNSHISYELFYCCPSNVTDKTTTTHYFPNTLLYKGSCYQVSVKLSQIIEFHL